MQAKRLWETQWIVVLLQACNVSDWGRTIFLWTFSTSYIYETRQVEPIASDQELIGYTEAKITSRQVV